MAREVNLIRIVEYDPEVEPGEVSELRNRMLVVLHSHPVDPDDNTEFAFQIPLLGIATRAEALGWNDYSEVVRMAIQLAVAEINGEVAEAPTLMASSAIGNPGVSPFAVSTAEYFSGAVVAAENMELPTVPAAFMSLSVAGASQESPVLAATYQGLDAITSALRSESGPTTRALPSKAADALARVADRSATVRTDARAMIAARRANVTLVGNGVHQELDNWVRANGSLVEGTRNWWMDHVLEASGARGVLSSRVEAAYARAQRDTEDQV